MLLCIELGIFFVDTVDTKIKASNTFNAMFVNTVNTYTGVCGSFLHNTLCQCENSA